MNVSSENISAVILAGGFGTRIKHLLGDLPKPMAPVNGKPFLEWVVRWLAAQNIRRVILSTGHLSLVVCHGWGPRLKPLLFNVITRRCPRDLRILTG